MPVVCLFGGDVIQLDIVSPPAVKTFFCQVKSDETIW